MVKPEWGVKRACPKCGTRFYDLGNEDPVTCVECGVQWAPEAVLKSKQPMPFEETKKPVEPEKQDSDLADDPDLDIDEDAETNPDDEVDIGDGDDIQLDTGDDSKSDDS